MTRRTAALLAALTLTTGLFASACSSGGGDDDSQSPAPAPATSAPNSPTAQPSPSAGPSDAGSPSSSPSAAPSASAPGAGTHSPSAPPAPSGSASPAPASNPASAPATGPASPGGPGQALWHPAPGTSWQWQLSGTVDQSVDAPVYDIDGFENDASVVASLHAKGRKVICYINVGAWESFRPDASSFPSSVLGSSDGWKGEKWFDIRQISVLQPLLAKRFDMCKEKGFDAVEPDLLEAYSNNSGFPVTADDQLAYNKMIAQLAHQRGLAVALKNDVDQVPQLVDYFDFSVDEQCAEFQECDGLTPFIKQGKAVLHVEYNVPNSQYCAQSKQLQLSSMEKHLNLDAWREPC
ncbi:endo alpha-1,4 polygalactosaminidase [Kitasatospora sp. NBC_01287]|uniref:endo alpha-1,4 polygalactosaminidase n=1 Tax=Kitasatospora sp. NBC_01287 TaxID=2903573 RepID=UPI002256046C|nr:endo alpha-1,4 polygalactosaminidase [Kitasatospora sp. NBC_01287]MCX4747935.1 endo alpha-1,4 polygalactosaminidase [Kitasatospora sp. NBC_01287]